jgi:adenylate kinase
MLQTEEAVKPAGSQAEVSEGGQQKLAVVLFGAPGSGKGTQAQFLVERMGIPQLSTGDMLRAHIREDDEVGHSVKLLMKAGLLAPDVLVNGLVAERLAKPDTRNGFILDGYPRTVPQAEVLLRLLDLNAAKPVVIHIILDYNIIIERLAARRQCPKCGTVYNLVWRPPLVPGICDLDGEKLIARDDDREQVIRERLRAYETQTEPVIEFFRKKGGRMFEIDASRISAQALSDRICEVLNCGPRQEGRL